MTADQRKKLIEIQSHLLELHVFGIEQNVNLSCAWRILHELLTEQHPFAEHWQEESV